MTDDRETDELERESVREVQNDVKPDDRLDSAVRQSRGETTGNERPT